MDDTDQFTDLLVNRHSLALAVAKELGNLHAKTIEEFKAGVSASPSWEALTEVTTSRGGSVNDWSAPVDGLPGHWWTGYLPALQGAKQTEYGAGVAGHISDHDGRFAITVYVQMNMRLGGISGAEFRGGVDDLPEEGDWGQWIAGGKVQASIPAADGDVAALVGKAVGVAEEYLKFAARLIERIADQRGLVVQSDYDASEEVAEEAAAEATGKEPAGGGEEKAASPR